ncbi:class II aldolase/adducin family protein [Glycomyces xiaoerkulensis]|uniref:class II aldolase/adducin family protein n=1 Tax=Glycomyces xiaoerkulensis TaxID=2038139 RepID=UPI000C25CF5D|nr:class II aldolase/adducin family protein [Glycomyces xiaoerkulensis]
MNHQPSTANYLADTETGLPLPKPPVFESVEDERRHRKQRLAAAMRLFGKFGYSEGISGHLSVRDPEYPDRFWVNPFGQAFERIRVADLVCVDPDGRVVDGDGLVNPSAFVIHYHIHDQRPDAVAVAHGHTVYARALGALGRLLEPLDQESAAFWNDQVLFAEYEGPAVDFDMGRRIAECLEDNRSILLAHHGLITVGGSIDEAAHWFFTYEQAARVQLAAASAGEVRPLDDKQARLARDGFGNAHLGWFSFQLLWDQIIAEQPDLLEE